MSRRHLIDITTIENVIREYSSGKSTVYISRKYGINCGSVIYWLKKNNVNRRNQSEAHRKYPLNENFFDTIDSPTKAYFLGLLYADGCNSPEQNLIRLILSKQDKPLLERLSAIIYKQPKPLIFRKGHLFTDNGRTYFRRDSYQLNISNKHMSEILIQHGLVKAKSFIVVFPKWIEESLISHFVRGYFDGDGCISFTKNRQIAISILGTENFCLKLKAIIDRLSIKSSLCHAKRGSPIRQLVIHGNQTGRKFMEWIYQDADIYMDRKHRKYTNILNVIPKARPVHCSICSEKHISMGYCKKHYYEFIGRRIRHERYEKEKR